MKTNRTSGFWVLIILGNLILLMLLMGQVMSIINYEFAVSIGLQESVNIVGEMGVASNKGFGVGDTIIYIPLLVVGMIGLWSKKEWGIITMAGALGITAYWPVVNIFFLIFARGSQGFNFTNFTSYSIVLMFLTVYGILGIWYLCKNHNLLTNK